MDKLGAISRERTRRAKGLARLDLNCPPLPHTLFEAMAIRDNPGAADHKRVMQMVLHDPLVVSRLLKIVNSAYYGLVREIESADRAVRLLGPATIAEIVMGMNVGRLQTTLTGPAGELLGRFVREGLATAYASERIWTSVSGAAGAAAAYAAGLLSNFGQIILVYNYPDPALDLYAGDTEPSADREAAHFGCNAPDAAAFVAEQLAFPSELRALLFPSGELDPVHTVIQAARRAARQMALGFLPPAPAGEPRDPAWDRLRLAFPARKIDLDALQEEVMSQKDHIAKKVFQLLAPQIDRKPPGGSRGYSPAA